MYVGKRAKSILAVLLICGLLLVSVPCRVDAVGPVVFGPALKYAIGAGLVAGGLYSVNKDALNYAINDYWNKASDYVKHQWTNAVTYGTGIGIILLNDPLKASIKNYLDSTYTAGENVVKLPPAELYVASIGEWYDLEGFSIMGERMSLGPDVLEQGSYDRWIWKKDIMVGNTVIYTLSVGGADERTSLNWIKVMITGNYMRLHYSYYISPKLTDWQHYYDIKLRDIANILGVSVSELFYEAGETVTLNFVGDAAGFGNATKDRPDIKVPCPPVPAAEWPDQWVGDLLGDMTRTGNPTLDDETFVEECEREWDWYWDGNVAHIYRVPKGDPPKDPDDEPIRRPPPPVPIPLIPPYPEPDPIPQPAEPCPYCPPNPYPSPNGDPCPNPYCPNQPSPVPVPVPQPATPAEPCPYCPPNPYPSPNGQPCPNPYCPNQPNPQPVPTPPPDIQPYYDDPEINWEPLRRSLYELTEKFPFCLPWDLMRGIQRLESNQWDRKIRIDVGDGIWPAMVIDLTMFDGIARITRVVLLVVFDLGLIFATRRLMGGDV